MSIQKGHLYLEGYTYINCSDNNSDTVGDIRFRVDSISDNLLIEECTTADTEKGGGAWALYNPKIVSKEYGTGSIPFWKDSYLYKSPIALESETSSNYIDYVLSEGGVINDYSILYDIYGDSTISRVVVNSGLRVTDIPNSAGNFLTNVNGIISQRTTSEVLSDLGALTEVNWGDIGGILSNQSDLQYALDLKENAFSASTASKFFSWDKTWRSIDYSYLINTPDLTALGYWTTWTSGIRSDNGLISIRDDSGANEMLLGYDWHGGDYALTLPVGINGILIAGYDEVSEDFRYGGNFPFPYMSLSDSKLVIEERTSDPQLRTTYIANAYYNDDLESTPSSHILLYDDNIIAYRAASHEFENPYPIQGSVWIASDLDLELSGRDRATALSYVLGTNGTRVIERTVANFISDNDIFISPLTTKGDIIVYNGTTEIRLPAGANGQLLSSDNTQSSGLKWINAGSVSSFLDLSDTLSTYSGYSEWFLIVKDSEDGIDFQQYIGVSNIGTISSKKLLGRYSTTTGVAQVISLDPSTLALSDAGVLSVTSTGGGATAFLGLTDTPSSYTGYEEYFVMVNDSADGLYFELNVSYSRIGTLTSKRILGRYSTTNGVAQQIEIGTGLGLSDAGVLYATGGGTGTLTLFTELTDTPSSYSSYANHLLQVNSGETGLEFVQRLAFSQLPTSAEKKLIGRYSSGTGDLQYLSIDPTTLSINASGVLSVIGGTSGMSNPMTTRGDLIYYSVSANPDRLPIGSVGQVLTSNGTDPYWADAPGGTYINPLDGIGQFIIGGVSGVQTKFNAVSITSIKNVITQINDSGTPSTTWTEFKFRNLADTPNSYSNSSFLRSTTTGLEWRTPAQVKSDIGAIGSLLEDTTPELYFNLDANGNTIYELKNIYFLDEYNMGTATQINTGNGAYQYRNITGNTTFTFSAASGYVNRTQVRFKLSISNPEISFSYQLPNGTFTEVIFPNGEPDFDNAVSGQEIIITFVYTTITISSVTTTRVIAIASSFYTP